MHATLIFKHFDWLSAENCFKEISLIVLHFTVQKIASAHSWTCDFWSLKQLLCQLHHSHCPWSCLVPRRRWMLVLLCLTNPKSIQISIFVFSIQLTVNKCSYEVRQWLDSNIWGRNPIKAQPLPISVCFLNGPSLFLLIFVFSANKQYNFCNKTMWQNVHPVYSTGIWIHNLQNMSHVPQPLGQCMLFVISVTRLGDLLGFGQLFKAFGNN